MGTAAASYPGGLPYLYVAVGPVHRGFPLG